MSNSDYREINNALNNYYGNKMNLYEEGTEYREEYRQKMKEQKKLVKELSIKAAAFDEIRGYSEDQMAYDLDDSYVLSNVSYAIQKTVDETEDY